MARRRRGKDQYDYENSFTGNIRDLDGIFVEEMVKNRVGLHYATKTIKSGPVFEVEIYPVFNLKSDIPRVKLDRDNRKAQNSLNNRNSRKRLIRLVNTNFGDGDYWITLTYMDGCYPKTEREARKHIGNYIKRVNRHRKKAGLKNAKYIYIMEWQEPEEGEDGTRCHFHLLMEGGIGRDELENMWKYSVVNDTSRIHPDADGITGLATYIADKPRRKKGQRSWTPSKGLKQPKESVNHSKTKKSQVERMARDYGEIQAYFERDKAWKQYDFVDAEVMYNSFNCAFYVKIRARERSWERDGRKKKEGAAGGGNGAVHRRTRTDSGTCGKHGGGCGAGADNGTGRNAGNTPSDGGNPVQGGNRKGNRG